MQSNLSKMLAFVFLMFALAAWGQSIASVATDASPVSSPAISISSAEQVDPAKSPQTEARPPWIKRVMVRLFYSPLESLLKNMIFTVPFWGALAFTLLMERLIPAEKNRKIFSAGFGQDLVWFFYEPFLDALVVGTYVAVLQKLHTLYFANWTFYGLTQAPAWVRIMLGLLLVDFGYWLQHRINHAVPFLWRLHALHHSQTELNFFTDFRYHPVEYIVRHTFVGVPFIFLQIDPPVIVAVVIFKSWYSRFYHGNIRTNLGPLRFLLVTPQSHRVHHSVERQHHDTNFGGIFSIWDHLFGTQFKDYHVYPATGVAGDKFTDDHAGGLKKLLKSPWSQMWRRLFQKYE